MFALNFDTLKRKAATKGVNLHKVITCQTGTDEYEAWAGLFISPDNDTLHMSVEDDNRTYTFYTIHKPKEATNVAV